MKKRLKIRKLLLGKFYDITFIVGFFLLFGIIGGFEQNTLNVYQLCLLAPVSFLLMIVGSKYAYSDREDNCLEIEEKNVDYNKSA